MEKTIHFHYGYRMEGHYAIANIDPFFYETLPTTKEEYFNTETGESETPPPDDTEQLITVVGSVLASSAIIASLIKAWLETRKCKITISIDGKDKKVIFEGPNNEKSIELIQAMIEGLAIESKSLRIESHYLADETPSKQKQDLRVFLCYSLEDILIVEKFYNFLINDGIDAWLNKKNLIPGQNWQIEIPKAVKNSHVVVVFLSSKSVAKEGFVQKEVKIALDTADEKPDGTIFIIPAKLENCEVPERLSKYQWVNLFDEDGYERLFKALQTRARSLDIVINHST